MRVSKEAVGFMCQAINLVRYCKWVLDSDSKERSALWQRSVAYALAQASEFLVKGYLHMNDVWPSGSHNLKALLKECSDNDLKALDALKEFAAKLYVYSANTRYEFTREIADKDLERIAAVVDKVLTELWEAYYFEITKWIRENIPQFIVCKFDEEGLTQEVLQYLPNSEAAE